MNIYGKICTILSNYACGRCNGAGYRHLQWNNRPNTIKKQSYSRSKALKAKCIKKEACYICKGSGITYATTTPEVLDILDILYNIYNKGMNDEIN